MKRIVLHAPLLRIWHWLNAVCFFILIVTGAQIRYRGIIDLMQFRTAVDIHNFFGYGMLAAYLLWAGYYASAKMLKIYLPGPDLAMFVQASLKQMRYYGYGIFGGEKDPHHATPEHKFNPLQQASYLFVMFAFMPLQIITGILLWDIDRFAAIIESLGGMKIIDSLHVLLTAVLIAFLCLHMYLSLLGRTPMEHIKAMFTGYEEEPEENV